MSRKNADKDDAMARMEKLLCRIKKLEECLDRIHEILNKGE
tara:strand:- start:1006 stop:1128 length:123 start_codon:yes stop_codon:yes gene_type:complete